MSRFTGASASEMGICLFVRDCLAWCSYAIELKWSEAFPFFWSA